MSSGEVSVATYSNIREEVAIIMGTTCGTSPHS
jgi:hypothetical protein